MEQRDQGNWGVMHLIPVMVYECVQLLKIYLIVYFKYIQFFLQKFSLNKVNNKTSISENLSTLNTKSTV